MPKPPMRRPTAHHFYILLALAERLRHGAGIMREVQRLSDGDLTLWPAQLYTALESLQQKGWIEELQEQPAGQSGRKRYFSISGQGRRELAKETGRMSSLVALSQNRNPLLEAEKP